VDRIEAGPILEDVVGGERLGPGDLDGVDELIAREVKDDPLRMERIIVTRVPAGEIGIALPVGALVSVGDAGEADIAGAVIAGDTAMRQCVTEGVANEASGGG
jgi:hypothetical protein